MKDRLRSTSKAPSHARLSSFVHCQRKYFYRYVLCCGEEYDEKTPWAHGGKLGHKALHGYYTAGAMALPEWGEEAPQTDPWTEGMLHVILRNYEDHWKEKDDLKALRVKVSDLKNVIEARYEEDEDGYLSFNEGTFIVQTPVGPILIQPDFVGTDWSGDLCIVDHKFTGGYLGKRVYGDAKHGFQLRLYAYGVGHMLGKPVTKAYLNAIHVGPGQGNPKSKAQLFDRYPFDYSPGDFEDLEAWVLQAKQQWDDLESRDPDEVWWLKNAGEHCSYCSFESLCSMSPRRRPVELAGYYQLKEAARDA